MKVLFFAGLRELMGESVIELDIDTSLTVAELKTLIRLPTGESLASWSQRQSLLAAVDQAMGSDATVVDPGAEVAFFPPVTGG